jgi:DNA/RNA-binding domain of Phe-tRNA-synthetase-like protein
MYLKHSPEIWSTFPELSVGVIHAIGINNDASVNELIARQRLSAAQEGEFAEIKAWRRVFAKMGLKPTQYRCASESLLRRFRKENSLPSLHPLVDLCNAISLASAIPIAVFDVDKVQHFLEVRHAIGTESYLDLLIKKVTPTHAVGPIGKVHCQRFKNKPKRC